MKQWISRILLIAAALAAAVWLYTVLFPGPEKVIRKRLDQVANLVSVRNNEGELARLANASKLASYAAPEISVNVLVPGRGNFTVEGREDLLKLVMGARSNISNLDVQFLDIVVRLAEDKQSAVVNLTAKGQGSGGWGDIGVQELKFIMRRISGEWLIWQVSTVRTLS